MDLYVEERELAQLQARSEADGRQCVVGAVIVDERGRAFAQKRSATRRLFPNCWDLIGGHVEAGETLAEALSREIREETGWELRQIVHLVHACDWQVEEGRGRREFDFLVQVAGDLAHPQLEWSKNSTYRWFCPAELDILLENRPPGETLIYEVVRKGLAFLSSNDGQA